MLIESELLIKSNLSDVSLRWLCLVQVKFVKRRGEDSYINNEQLATRASINIQPAVERVIWIPHKFLPVNFT